MERFWSKVAKSPEPDECWLWTAALSTKGYGHFWFDGRMREAHRIAWKLERDDPGELDVLHSCDNPRCVRLDHLFLGTHGDNMRDMAKKGRRRGPIGEAHHFAKLTPELVREIRASDEPVRSVAARLGMAFGCIHAARVGKTWKHVV